MTERTPNMVGDLWSEMETEKGDLIERSREYARWTVPSVLPEEHSENREQEKSSVMIGARLVNHLANRIVDVLFPTARPFFTVSVTPEARMEAEQETGAEEAGKTIAAIQEATANVEKAATRKLKLTEYRPIAIEASKSLIVTGNGLIRRMPSGKRIFYGIDKHTIRRDIEGNPIEVILYDKKLFSTFDPGLQLIIQAGQSAMKKQLSKPKDEVVLLTHYKLGPDGRWCIQQEADGVPIGVVRKVTKRDFDLLPLAWNLKSGEHYARGLVEDYAATFHKLDVTTEAATDLMAIICDVKFFVKPGSALSTQIGNLNRAKRGSYFAGNKDDITVPELGQRSDLAVMMQAIEKWEGDLSRAFLLSSVRDAERVTAEEIRMIANELESSFGGLYSQLALNWQLREAEYALGEIDFKQESNGRFEMFEVLVTTGLESLSREGQLNNLRLAITDLQMLDGVPEDVRGAINPLRFAQHIFTNRAVDIKAFLNTPEEMRANQEAALAQAGRLEQQGAEARVAEHAGKKAIDDQ